MPDSYPVGHYDSERVSWYTQPVNHETTRAHLF